MEVWKKTISNYLLKTFTSLQVRKITKVRSLSTQLTALKIQEELTLLLPKAPLKQIYELQADITMNFLFESEIDEGLNVYDDIREQISTIIESIREKPCIAERIVEHAQLIHFYWSLHNSQFSEIELSRWKNKVERLGSDIHPLNWELLDEFEKSLNKKLKEIRKSAKAFKDRRVEGVREILFSKISFTPEKIVPWIAIFSALFFLSGYYYVSQTLDYFGIKTGMYFPLADYLASSINNLHMLLISSFIGCAAYIVGVHKSISESILRAELGIEETGYTRNDKLIRNFFIVSFIGIITAVIFDIKFLFDMYFSLIIYIVSMVSILVVPIEKYFSNHVFIRILLSILIIQFFQLERMIRIDLDKLMATKQEFPIKYKFKDESSQQGNIRLITANSVYFFFFETDTKKSFIVKRDHVDRIEFNEKEEKGLSLFDSLRTPFDKESEKTSKDIPNN
jgi:hypothetical protein